MDSTVAVQTKGWGCSFPAAKNSVIAFSTSSTLRNEPRRTRLEVNSANQRSIKLSQVEVVGIPDFRKIIVAKMKKLAEIGADGIHIDKLWPNPGLDFNPFSTLSPDQATSMGRLLALDEILKSCKAVNPEFSISTECAWDRGLTYSNVAWAWHSNCTDHVPVLKYTFPEWFPGLSISQPFDFTGVNNAVRWGCQLMLGPGNYMIADSMAYPPWRQLSKYIQEILRMLESVKDTICFGEFLDTQLVQFEGPEEMRYSMFQNPKTGKRACVIVNMGRSPTELP